VRIVIVTTREMVPITIREMFNPDKVQAVEEEHRLLLSAGSEKDSAILS